ncbi:hypothetical protein K491DRAFT_697568 [Lophiostoma macrostomum CBS 122681]|uniref:Px domain containing protein n=1 Tax=Lophiostoma macrostomum CBS 122681 TaxID=1314788 RepID=A0A6A6SV91_9PLEO|nr:hypothetical protein K491DRAFT_697568 [Lophiostoma macrostomum CBS 122681]
MSPQEAPLTPAQTHALFDILIHHQLYAEIEAFKYANTITTYGYPFRKEDGVQTTSPLLQNMVNKFALRLPGLRNVGLDFWQDKVKVLVQKLAEAELSESYDKGAIGARKALATAVSAVLEYVARGALGGYARRGRGQGAEEKEYDTSIPDDVLQAWEDMVREAIYGDLLEEMVKKVAESGKLEDHTSLVKGAHEYIVLNIASFMHHIFIMSPDGQYLLRLLENVHRLIPYTLVRQTLRVGNAATMINGMVKLVLTKISVTAVTNWIGLTNNANDGMNLMQQILSTVMAWDTSEFSRRAQKLESARDGPDKKVFKAIKNYVYSSRDQHDAARNISIQESKSIISVILSTSSPSIEPESLTDHQHNVAMEYYSTLLSIRDREELTKVLCKMQPDMLTSLIRDGVFAFDPIIRAVHNAVDLSGTITDAESFLTDLIKVSKPRRGAGLANSTTNSRNNSRETSPAPVPENPPASVEGGSGAVPKEGVPTVEDYVALVRKHIPSSHKFFHQVCKNAPDLANQYLEYMQSVVAEFRVHSETPEQAKGNTQVGDVTGEEDGGAGNMTAPLHALFSTLSQEQQEELRGLLDHHETHLKTLKKTSRSRLETIMVSTNPQTTNSSSAAKGSKGSTHGPGIYLSRWHSLLDSTLITPATLNGPVRHGWEVKGELDGKGLKTDTLLVKTPLHKRGRSKDKSGNGGGGQGSVNVAEGTGDAVERKERKRDGIEEERTEKVWEGMRVGWVGVCRGLEVMGLE